MWQAEIAPSDVRIPVDQKLAHANTFDDTTRVLNQTRGGAAWECVGHAMACMEAAVSYAKERCQFGRPIAGFQLVQAKLATMQAATTAMHLVCFRLAQLQGSGAMTGPMASLAKLHNVRNAKLVRSGLGTFSAATGYCSTITSPVIPPTSRSSTRTRAPTRSNR